MSASRLAYARRPADQDRSRDIHAILAWFLEARFETPGPKCILLSKHFSEYTGRHLPFMQP